MAMKEGLSGTELTGLRAGILPEVSNLPLCDSC